MTRQFLLTTFVMSLAALYWGTNSAQAQWGISIGGDRFGFHYYDDDDHHHHGYHPYYYDDYHHGSQWGVRIGPRYGYDRGSYYDGYYRDGYDRDRYYRESRPVERRRRNPNSRSFSSEDIAAGSLEEQSVTQAGLDYLNQAQQAFRQAEYEQALRLINHAIVEMPKNGKVHLVASQALFAVGDYQSAASALAQGISLLEEDHWGFIVKNYSRFYANEDYVKQMDRLTKHLKENPDDVAASLVRGYHWSYLGYDKAARKDLTKVTAAMPEDEIANRLLARVGGSLPAKPEAAEEEEVLPPPTAE